MWARFPGSTCPLQASAATRPLIPAWSGTRPPSRSGLSTIFSAGGASTPLLPSAKLCFPAHQKSHNRAQKSLKGPSVSRPHPGPEA